DYYCQSYDSSGFWVF
nr:immunoglobulin light chain junction region [Macaca mulatta]MOX17549.1 immunoglobulin light chain junction region [Macaca mulatta]MOX18117.1 immunoglobulin light chain junction region [Macaca mulatta]MOX18208.1 immunoglobulin light chain junction region [Macaca mulatta]MOX18320.1 immunoglobulin light chain junction region [Macaca mulatta]